MKKKASELIEILKESQKTHLDIGLNIMNSGQRKLLIQDIFLLAMIQRSKSTIRGFCKEIDDNNFLCAAPLVRIHLDTLLNTYAMFISEKQSDFAFKKLKGKQTSELKDRFNHRMGDRYLARKLSEDTELDANWALDLYSGTSDFVHVSDKHLLGIFSKALTGGKIEMKISETSYIPKTSKREIISAMIKITFCLFRLWHGWSETKNIMYPTK